MGLLASFWKWLTTAAKSKTDKGHPDLYPLDVDKLARELNLVDEAKRLGLAGVPSSDAMVLTGPEAAVVQRVEKARQAYVDWAVRRLGILSHDLAKKIVTKSVNRALQADKEFEREASGLLTEQESSLPILRETAIKGQNELEAFRLEHGLTREADFPSPGKLFFLKGAVVVMGIVEAAANAVFFAEGDRLGLTGGFVHAAVYAAGNVAVAYWLGKHGVRQLHHKSAIWRSVGAASLCLALVGMFVIGLSIAHVRDALSAGLLDAQSVALQTLIESPFGLSGTKSIGLFGISIGFALASLFDGLATDDRYPGYGKMSRRAKVFRQQYDEELDELRTEMGELKDKHLAALDQEVQKCQSAIALVESFIDGKAAAELRLDSALRDVDNSMDALLKLFRTENQVHRGGSPIPGYFEKKPELEPLKLPNFNTDDDRVSLLEQQGLVKRLLNEEQALRTRIQEAFNAKIDPLEPLDTQFTDKEQR